MSERLKEINTKVINDRESNLTDMIQLQLQDYVYLYKISEKAEQLEQDLESETTLRMLHERKVRELEGRIENALETLRNCDGEDWKEANEVVN